VELVDLPITVGILKVDEDGEFKVKIIDLSRNSSK